MGNGRKKVCGYLKKTSGRDNSGVETHQCTFTLDAYSWLPTVSVPYQQYNGREYVCNGNVSPLVPSPYYGTGGSDRNILWVAQALALGVMAWFDDAIAEPDPSCYWRNKYIGKDFRHPQKIIPKKRLENSVVRLSK